MHCAKNTELSADYVSLNSVRVRKFLCSGNLNWCQTRLLCQTRASVVHGTEACNGEQSYLCTCVVLSALIAAILRNGRQQDSAQHLREDCNCVSCFSHKLWKCYARFPILTHYTPLHHVYPPVPAQHQLLF